MATAVILTGGRQYRVAEGDRLELQKLGGKPGDLVSFDKVLMIAGEALKVGRPTVTGAKVRAEILGHGKGEKLVVAKFKRRKRYKRKNGARQEHTAVKITKIEV